MMPLYISGQCANSGMSTNWGFQPRNDVESSYGTAFNRLTLSKTTFGGQIAVDIERRSSEQGVLRRELVCVFKYVEHTDDALHRRLDCVRHDMPAKQNHELSLFRLSRFRQATAGLLQAGYRSPNTEVIGRGLLTCVTWPWHDIVGLEDDGVVQHLITLR
jgi:hypothetical protein